MLLAGGVDLRPWLIYFWLLGFDTGGVEDPEAL